MCPSDIHTCYRPPYRDLEPLSQAQHCHCALLESVYGCYRAGPRNLFWNHRHKERDVEFLLGSIRGLHQRYYGLPDCLPERFLAQLQSEEFSR